jgi:hypothetical protein
MAIKKYSTKNTYTDKHSGKSYNSKQIRENVVKAEKQAFLYQEEIYGYNFCIECKRNSSFRLNAAHIISVKECKETGEIELAWDYKNNMDILCQDICHAKRDKLNIQSAKIKTKNK